MCIRDRLNIEADYETLMEWSLEKRNEAVAMGEAIKALAATYAKRQKRYEVKAERMKEVAGVIMNCAKERKYEGKAGTIGFRNTPRKVVISDEAKVPAIYKKTSISLDLKMIGAELKSGNEVIGAMLSNGGETLTITK